MPGWELPKEWAAPDGAPGGGLRAEGMLEANFVSDGPGCAPDLPTRKELRRGFLCGAALSF